MLACGSVPDPVQEKRLSIPDHEPLRLIGRGSYGEVWLARNLMGTYRAVKVVYHHSAGEDRAFEREFAGITRYEPVSRSHEGLIQVLHVGRSGEANCFYYIMELADDAGQKTEAGRMAPPFNPETYSPKTLRSEINRRGSLPLEQCLSISLSLAAGLAHLHQRGLLHRDLKPSNIIFVNDRPKLADIGLVAEVGEAASVVGTEGFIAPEGSGTPQADLYALGKVLYEMSTGKDRQNFPELPAEWLDGRRELLEFNEIVLKACDANPARRYRSAEEVQAELALLQIGKSVRRLRAVERQLAFMKHFGLAAALVGLLAVGGYLVAKREARLEREQVQRIERAEQEARRQLWNAYLAQARAGRHSGMTGARLDSLEAIRRAAAMTNPPSLRAELRSEAAACLSLVDLRPLSSVSIPRPSGGQIWLDGALERCAVSEPQGDIRIRRLGDSGEEFVLPGSGSPVTFLYRTITRDRFLAAGYRDGHIRVWDLTRRALALDIPNVPLTNAVEFSADNRLLAFTRTDREIALYDLESRAWTRTVSSPEPVRDVVFSPDGRTLAVLPLAAHEALLLSLDDGRLIARLPHPSAVAALVWQPGGSTLATACADSHIRVWDAADGQLLRTLSGHLAEGVQVAFHPSGQFLASASWDGTTRLWDAITGDPLVVLPSFGSDLRFSRDGRRLAFVIAGENSVQLIEVVDERIWRPLLERPKPSASKEFPRGPWGIEFSPDGRLLVSAGDDGVRFWDPARGQELGHLPVGHTYSALFGPRGEDLVLCGESGISRWPMTAGESSNQVVLGPPRTISARDRRYKRGSQSADGAVLAYLHESYVSVRKGDDYARLPGLVAPHSVAVSADGRWIAASSFGEQNQVLVWETGTGRQLWAGATGERAVMGVPDLAFSTDGRWLVSGAGKEFCFWDVQTGRPVRRLPRRNAVDLHGPVAFSRDGRLLALALSRTQVQLLDAATGAEIALLDPPVPGVISWLAFSPAGSQLAVATESHLIQLWDLARLREELRALRLDWDQPPLPPATVHPALRVETNGAAAHPGSATLPWPGVAVWSSAFRRSGWAPRAFPGRNRLKAELQTGVLAGCAHGPVAALPRLDSNK